MYELSPNLQGTTLSLGLIGDVTLDDVVAFNNEMREHSKTPNITQLVLNLSQVSSMDAAGLGVLVSLNTSMQRYGRRLVLLCLAPHIDRLLKEAEIEGFFATCESEEELKGFIPEASTTRKNNS